MAAVSVIIPTYERPVWLHQCLDALSRQHTVDFEVIVIDDGSHDPAAAADVARPFQDKLRLIYCAGKHVGHAGALNAGLARAQGDIVCFLDDDSIVCADWIDRMTRAFEADPRAGIVNGRTLSFDRRRESLSFALQESVYRPGKRWATCNVAYRACALRQAGGFDERYRHPCWHWTDNDAGLRVEWRGWRHVYEPAAIVFHDHEQSIPEFVEKCRDNGRGFAVFFKKFFFSRFFFVLGVFCWIAKDIVRVLWPGRRHRFFFLWSYYSLAGFFETLAKKKARTGG